MPKRERERGRRLAQRAGELPTKLESAMVPEGEDREQELPHVVVMVLARVLLRGIPRMVWRERNDAVEQEGEAAKQAQQLVPGQARLWEAEQQQLAQE